MPAVWFIHHLEAGPSAPDRPSILNVMRALALLLTTVVVLLAACGSSRHAHSTTVHDLSETFNTAPTIHRDVHGSPETLPFGLVQAHHTYRVQIK